jgi:hypothetical protein
MFNSSANSSNPARNSNTNKRPPVTSLPDPIFD